MSTNPYDPLEKRNVFSREYCIFNVGYWCNHFFVVFSGLFWFFNKPNIGHVILLAGKCDFCRHTSTV